MKVLICALTYGGKPLTTIYENILKTGYPAEYIDVCTDGIARALNDGIDAMKLGGFDSVGFMANDIIEPENWLKRKVDGLLFFQNAGIVSTPIHQVETQMLSQHIIGNWLIGKEVIEKIGYFNEEFHPYGPIDLDYCDRANVAGFGTYYVKGCIALHPHSHAEGNEYGYDKKAMVDKYWPEYVDNQFKYKNGLKPIYLDRHYETTMEMQEFPTL